MTPQCGRSVVQVLVVRVDIGVVIYEAMTSQCGRSVVQVLGPVSQNNLSFCLKFSLNGDAKITLGTT